MRQFIFPRFIIGAPKTAAVLLIIVYFFDKIVLETSSVSWIRNKSIVFVVCQIFENMEYPWLQIFSSLLVLNRTDPTRFGIGQKRVDIFLKNIVIVGLYISPKLI